MGDDVPWSGLRERAPELTSKIEAVLAEHRFVMLGTIRRDGRPRISPVETHVVDDELMVVMIPHTRKAQDVLRDPRVVMQSPIVDPADPGTEVKLTGRVSARIDQPLRQSTIDRIEEVSGWQAQPDWLFLSVAIGGVGLIEWQRGDMLITCWSPESGMRGPERRRLDMAAGRYRIITS